MKSLNFFNLLKKNNKISYLRNMLSIKPVSIYDTPQYSEAVVSDFFYFNNRKNYDTKFYLTNISSQILPEIPQKDLSTIVIYDSKGNIIFNKGFELEPFETKEIVFSDLKINDHGSFFAFHKYQNYEELINNKSFITDRGYVAYKKNDGVWTFMHGNHNSGYFDDKKNFISLNSKSLFTKKYTPQVEFNDTNCFELVFNNPSNKRVKISIQGSDKTNNLIKKEVIYIDPFCTDSFKFKNNNFDFIDVLSNFYICRPVIIKYYNTYFDIFHG